MEGPETLYTLKGEEHALRRRRWDHGMSSESLKNYADLISRRGSQFVQELVSVSANGAVDMSAWMSYFSSAILLSVPLDCFLLLV